MKFKGTSTNIAFAFERMQLIHILQFPGFCSCRWTASSPEVHSCKTHTQDSYISQQPGFCASQPIVLKDTKKEIKRRLVESSGTRWAKYISACFCVYMCVVCGNINFLSPSVCWSRTVPSTSVYTVCQKWEIPWKHVWFYLACWRRRKALKIGVWPISSIND